MKKPIALVSVINDLATDQRVDRSCKALIKCGYEVLLVGRVLKKSLPLAKKPYKMHRMKLLFTKGPAFYLEFQIRLFYFLLRNKPQLVFSNDLDTLLPNYIISKLYKAKIIYDTHELFCDVPELIDKPMKRKFWKLIEKSIFPKLKKVITVNTSIANIYQNKYGNTIHVVRNIPEKRKPSELKSRSDLGLPTDKKIIILQGAGINIDRGAEESVEAMQWVKNAILLIIGGGDVIDKLKKMREDLGLQDKVTIYGKLPQEKLFHYTQNADLGLSMDKNTNLNYELSLPNKIFDYIHAGVPLFVSKLKEVEKIVIDYSIGFVADNHNPVYLSKKINEIFENPAQIRQWKKNLLKARDELNWDVEEQILINLIKS